LLIVLLFIFISCPSFKRNPNLCLFLKEKNYNLLNPRWTKSGWIYYIKCYEEAAYYGSGEVWRVKENGDSNLLFLAETISTMDISPSETLLVGAISNSEPSDPMILYNLATGAMDTIGWIGYGASSATGLKFGFTDTFIYYVCYGGDVHRRNIFTQSDTVLTPSGCGKFSIYRDSLLYWESWSTRKEYILDMVNDTIIHEATSAYASSFFPFSPDSMLIVWEHDGILIYDINNGKTTELDAAPYESTIWAEIGNCIDFDPSGQKIIFCASGTWLEGTEGYPFELWVLEEF